MMDVWLGIDGTNWVHALYHALRGRDVLQHLCRRARILADHLQASVTLICFDCRSFRHGLSPSYKANRLGKEEALLRLLAEAPDRVAAAGQPVYQEGFEADDCLATLAAIARCSQAKCVLASADKDLFQCLVDGRVGVLRKFETAGAEVVKPSLEWMTARELEISEKYNGLRPACWADYQALVGEPGDNVLGCPSWGEKTARRALGNAGSIAAMLKDPWAVNCTGKQMALLQAWAKSGAMKLALDLVTLRTDVAAVRDAIS